MAVTLGALRLGKLDVAIGNLLGSNLCDVMILAVDDAVYVRRPLLADAAIMAVVMTGLLIIGLVMRPQERSARAELDQRGARGRLCHQCGAGLPRRRVKRHTRAHAKAYIVLQISALAPGASRAYARRAACFTTYPGFAAPQYAGRSAGAWRTGRASPPCW
jgi:hypothetical protein